MVIDGNKLRQLRQERGMSQEKLAINCDVNKRTIQRAENNCPIAVETLAFIAEALEVKPRDLRENHPKFLEGEVPPTNPTNGEIILLPCSSGRRLVDALRSSGAAHFDYTVEPTDQNLSELKNIAELLNKTWVDRWTPLHEIENLNDAGILELKAEANRVLRELSDKEIIVYLGTYTARGPKIFCGEFGEMYSEADHPEILLTKCIVEISEEKVSYFSMTRFDNIDNIDFENTPF